MCCCCSTFLAIIKAQRIIHLASFYHLPIVRIQSRQVCALALATACVAATVACHVNPAVPAHHKPCHLEHCKSKSSSRQEARISFLPLCICPCAAWHAVSGTTCSALRWVMQDAEGSQTGARRWELEVRCQRGMSTPYSDACTGKEALSLWLSECSGDIGWKENDCHHSDRLLYASDC